MFTTLRLTLAALMLAALPGCSSFGGDEPETVEPVPTAPAVLPMEDVRSVEIGRTWDGLVLTAFGLAPGLGYADPRLEARRGGRLAPDGYLDFDFVATAPAGGSDLPRGRPEARLLRADRLIGLEAASRAKGVRIHAARGGRAIAF